MTHIWVRGAGGPWVVAPIAGEFFQLSSNLLGARSTPARDAPDVPVPLIRRCYETGAERWVLVIPRGADIRVNGEPVLTQIRLLRHRDSVYSPEIGTVYFSTERLAKAETFTGAGDTQYCGRCKKPFAPGQAVIRCPDPTCGLLHHKHADSKRCCWQYLPQCSGCDQPTALDAGLQWLPEEASE